MTTNEIENVNLAGVGPKLLAHSKAAEFTARRGLVVELFPFIFGASGRMSSRAISDYLAKEQGVKLSAVTINLALKDPAKNWNLFFDTIEPSARIYALDDGKELRDFLFKKTVFLKPIKQPVLKAVVNAASKALVPDEVVQACRILRTKWYVIDLETRMKALPYLEHRLGGKSGK